MIFPVFYAELFGPKQLIRIQRVNSSTTSSYHAKKDNCLSKEGVINSPFG